MYIPIYLSIYLPICLYIYIDRRGWHNGGGGMKFRVRGVGMAGECGTRYFANLYYTTPNPKP